MSTAVLPSSTWPSLPALPRRLGLCVAVALALHLAVLAGLEGLDGARPAAAPSAEPARLELRLREQAPPAAGPATAAAAPAAPAVPGPRTEPMPRRPAAEPAPASRPAAQPAPAEALAGPAGPVVATPGVGSEAGPATGAGDGAAAAVPADSAPRLLNLDPGRLRRADLARRDMTGVLPELPQAAAAEDPLASEVAKAARTDCTKAYAGAGLLAVLPLAFDTLRGKGCRW